MPKNSDGRSMIEMLGVLAIIGMLAIGGVWGVGKAFTKHNANNLIEDVRLAGFIVADEMFSLLPAEQEEVSMAGKFASKSLYDFTAFKETDITFAVVADSVSYSVCEEIRKRKVDWLEEIRANGSENTCKKDDDNAVSFFFNTQLNGNTEVSGECRTNKDCPPEKPYCRYGVCTKCENGLQLHNGNCTTCPSVGEYKFPTNASYCHTCGNNVYFSTWQSSCVDCTVPHSSVAYTTKSECARCPNRCWDEENQKCLDAQVGNVFNNNGICNYTCPTGQFAATNEFGAQWRCIDCPAIGGQLRAFSTTEQCHSCGSNYMSIWNGQYCRECSSSYFGDIPIEECKRCPNRCWDEKKQLCLDSIEGNPFNDNGVCNYNCPAGQLVASNDAGGQWQCTHCPAIGSHLRPFSTPEQCHSCGSNYYANSTGERCAECTNTFLTSVPKSECARCPNRCWDEEKQLCLDAQVGNVFNNNGICNYTCPTGQFVATEVNGAQWRCTDCPAIGTHLRPWSTPEQCHSCGSNYYANSTGERCAECTNTFLTSVPKSECDRCPNRYFNAVAQQCYLCPTGQKASDDGLSCIDL